MHELEERIAQHGAQASQDPVPQLADFEALAEDLEPLWQDPGTDAGLRKRIVRTLIKEVAADVDGPINNTLRAQIGGEIADAAEYSQAAPGQRHLSKLMNPLYQPAK